MKIFVTTVILLALHTELRAMPVAVFLKKAEALGARGILAMFSGDMKMLVREIKAAGQAARAEQAAAVEAGRKPPFCIPSEAGAETEEVLTHFRAIPPAQRSRVEVAEAFRGLMVRKYPCPS